MNIQLLSQQGRHQVGSIHRVKSVVPHGGNYDCAAQYRIYDGTLIPSNKVLVL